MASSIDTATSRLDRAGSPTGPGRLSATLALAAPTLVGAVGLAAGSLRDGAVASLQRAEVLARVSAANLAVGGALCIALAVVAMVVRGRRAFGDGARGQAMPALIGAVLAAAATGAAAAPYCYDALKALAYRDFSQAWRLAVATGLAAALGIAAGKLIGRTSNHTTAVRWLFGTTAVVTGAASAVLWLQHGAGSVGAGSVGAGWSGYGPMLWWVPCLLAAATVVASVINSRRTLRLAPWLAAALWAVPTALWMLNPPSTLPAMAGATPQGAPKTVLLLTIDTLRRDALATYNPRSDLTPNLQELGRQAVVFEDALSPSPWTRPALASLLTGLHPMVHGVTDTDRVLPPQAANLAEAFGNHGYVTVGVGSNHNIIRQFGFARGFDEYAMGSEPRGTSLGAGALKLWMRAEFTTTGITERAVDALERHADKPLFLWVHYLTPHIPYAPPERFLPDSEPAGDVGVYFGDTPREDPAEVNRSQPLSPQEREWVRALYDAEVRHADAAVGQLLDALKRVGRYDDAVIAFTSDHGEEFWDHGGFEHGHTMYAELLRAPLFVRAGADATPARVAARVSTHALFPTLLELAGLPAASDRIDVTSLVPYLSDPERAPAPAPFLASGTLYGEPRSAIALGDRKLIVRHDSQTLELYDTAADPGEQRNLSNQEATVVQRLQALLQIAQDDAGALRGRLGMQGDSRIDVDADTAAQLRELGYVR